MNELDLLMQFRTDIGEPSADAWQRARAAIAAAAIDPAAKRSPRRRVRDAAARHPRRSLAGLAGILGAAATATVATLLLGPSASTSAARAFPILKTAATSFVASPVLNALHAVAADGTTGDLSFQGAHAFSGTNAGTTFTGYVLQTTDGNTLCMTVARPRRDLPNAAFSAVASCGPTAQVEQQGLLMSWEWGQGDYEFTALVPSGGSVSLTANGATTTVPVDAEGIATGAVSTDATVSIHAGSSTLSGQLGPDHQPAPPRAPAPPPN